MTGKEDNSSIRGGIDLETEEIGNLDDPHFIFNNTVPGKKFSGGLQCQYKVNIVPCFVIFQESGSMTGIILEQVLHHLDTLEIFDDDLKKCKTPFVWLTYMIQDFILTYLSTSTVNIISGLCA